VERIARQVGKSVRYVYARMKLTEAAPEVKQALADGKIEASHADELVRLDVKEQAKALKEHCFSGGLVDGKWVDEAHTVSVSELKENLQEAAERKVRDAKFREAAEKRQKAQAAAQAKWKKDEEKRRREEKIQRAADRAVFDAVVGKVKSISGAVLAYILDDEIEYGKIYGHDEEAVAAVVGLELPKDKNLVAAIRKSRGKLTDEQRAKLLVAMRLGDEMDYGGRRLNEAAAALKVDAKKVRAEAALKAKAEQEKEDHAKAGAPKAKGAAAKRAAKKGGRK
jgi:hypothetical protein